jgi:broad-specificity NMP kinase
MLIEDHRTDDNRWLVIMSKNDNKKALVGAGLGLTLGAGAVLTLRPGLRKMLMHSINSVGKGGSRAVAAKGAIPKSVVKDARSIRKAIQQAGVDPRKVRVGIIATPGTGKSTMARALEAELGIKSISMDSAKSSPISGKRAKNFIDTQLNGKIPKGSILEQTHMPHSVDMDQFDVVVKLERDADAIINSIKKRGKGAHQADYINYNNLQGEINESFNSLSGSHLNTRKGVDIKIRGKSGFKSEQGRLNRAKKLGLDISKFKSLTQAQQLASLQAGKIIKPIGVTNSFKKGKLILDTGLVGGGLAGGSIYGHHMDKKASMNRDQKKKIAIGAGVGLGAAAAITLARRPGLRAHLGAKFNTMFSSGSEKALAKLNIKGDIPKQSIQHARRMINDLKRQGYSLKQIRKMNIGVVGSTGSGKSSLARAIEQELGVARMSLDDYVSYMPFKSGNVDVQKAIKSEGGLKGGTVVEQSQLLHSGDPSQFDVIMKIERPVKDIKKGLLERGHAAVTHDYVDLTKAQTTVNEAFGTIGGHKKRLGSGLEMVVNPKGGDQATRMRLDRARELGLDLDKFKGLSQRDQIQSLANKSIKSNQSFRAHISSGSLGQDITIGGGLALGGGATGAFMSKESSRHRINAIMAQIDQHNLEKNAFAGTAAALAGGALVGGTVGALAGGEGNRLGGAITGALTGAGLAYGGKQLMGGAGKLVSGGATGGTRATVIAGGLI